MKATIWQRVKPWCIPVVLTLFVYIILRCVILIGYVPTASMEPTLPEGSFIFGLRIFREPKVGDVIVFKRDGQLFVKRVAAEPGEQVDRTKLAYMTTVTVPVWEEPVVTVPEESYFVLGDNTQNSIDSRYWDNPFVEGKDVVAIVLGCPTNKFHWRDRSE